MELPPYVPGSSDLRSYMVRGATLHVLRGAGERSVGFSGGGRDGDYVAEGARALLGLPMADGPARDGPARDGGCVPEICDNGSDDDCDGLVDHADRDCITGAAVDCPLTPRRHDT